MRCRTSVLALVTGLLLAGATQASAAEIRLSGECFVGGQQRVQGIGSGFPAGAPVTLLRNGATIATGAANDAGQVTFDFLAPVPTANKYEQRQQVQLKGGGVEISKSFSTTKFTARTTHATSSDPNRAYVNFEVYGFGPGKRIYLHYFTPKGKHKRTIAIGTTRGVCGSLKTSKRKLFSFRPRLGKWALRFDTRTSAPKKPVPPYVALPITVYRLGS